jgi:hypothetical protein
MLDSTQAVRPVEHQRTATVTSLWTDVVLDDAAIEAQRLAVLAELTAERFDLAYVRAGQRGNSTELAAARHLEQGARLAREAAERERGRCAAAYGGTARGRVMA